MANRTRDNIVAIIPARGGSKGIPGKNIRPLNGKPLIGYAIELAKEAEELGLISGHIVSTDSREIAMVSQEFGGNVPFLRPNELATDDSPVVDTILHVVDRLENEQQKKNDHVLLLQPTNPLTTVKDVTRSVTYYLSEQPNANCLISVADAMHIRLSTLYYEKGRQLEQVLEKVNPVEMRQNQRKLYWRNGAIYLTRVDFLTTQHKIINKNPLFYEMPREQSIPIDDAFDWTIAELLIKRKQSSHDVSGID